MFYRNKPNTFVSVISLIIFYLVIKYHPILVSIFILGGFFYGFFKGIIEGFKKLLKLLKGGDKNGR
ncbi:MAG: hypothetical protein QW474_00545 [Candidatus Aenigmatarchaeota archaeon]